MRTTLVFALALVLGGCATPELPRQARIDIELAPGQVPRNLRGERGEPLPGSRQERKVFLLRGRAAPGQPDPLIATRVWRVGGDGLIWVNGAGPQASTADDYGVEFRDGRLWISPPPGGPVPFIDQLGRLLWLKPEQLFAVPAGGRSSDVERRVPLEQVVHDERRFFELGEHHAPGSR